MIIHFHTAIVPNSGELKRMKNIDRDFTSCIGEKSIEVVFFNSKSKNYVKEHGQFHLSENVAHKYYIPMCPKLGRITRMLTFIFLALHYQPSFVIGERGMYINNLWPFKFLSPKTKLVVDIHGAVAEELEYQGKSKKEVEKGRKEERIAVTSVDYVICQSDEMKRYIIKNYNVDSSKICVYRCGIDANLFKIDADSRDKIRKKLQIKNNDIVFVYSGGLHPWQRVDDSVDIFLKFHKEYPASKLIILTGDKDGVARLLEARHFDNSDKSIFVTRLPFVEVTKYLNAADVAFLMRHNHIMNAVASPTKLAEYMGCGLPVISTDVSKCWLDNEGLKYIINADEPLSAFDLVSRIHGCNKNEVSQFSHSVLSLEIDKSVLYNFLSKL